MTKKKNPVVHFEIGCRDAKRTKDFYADIFDWDITPNGPSYSIDTQTDKGIGGHITALGHEPHNYINIYIEVDDVAWYLAQVETKGGKTQVGPIPLPDGRQFAWFTDPDGNIIGLISPEPAS